MINPSACKKRSNIAPTYGKWRRSRLWVQSDEVMREGADTLILRADLPGLEVLKIALDLADGLLTVGGILVLHRGGGSSPSRRKDLTTDFQRTFVVSRDVDLGRLHAAYNDGVLTLRLPKHETVDPRKIPIE